MKNTLFAYIALALLTACSSGKETAEPRVTAEPAATAADSLAAAPLDSSVALDPATSAPSAPAGPSARPADAGTPREPAPTGGSSAAPAAQPAATKPAAAPAPGDSATRILERASQKYSAVRSLQADFTMSYENPLLKSRTTGTGTLYQKRPDLLLLRFSEPAGDVLLSDGQYFWVYYPSVQRDQVMRTAATESGASGVDLQAQFLGDPTRRFTYQLNGEESVGGRRAWLLTLTPRERTGYRKLRVWVDQRDYMARRFEITEDNGAIRRFELRNLRVDPTLSNALFRFEVPSGVRVITQ